MVGTIASIAGRHQPSPLVGSTNASEAAYSQRSSSLESSRCTTSTGGSLASDFPRWAAASFSQSWMFSCPASQCGLNVRNRSTTWSVTLNSP